MPQEFTLPDELKLTGGQTYHWAVEVVQNGIANVKTHKFKTPLAATGSSNTFSNVTILSRGIEPHQTQIDQQFQNLANNIATTGNGLVLQYDFNKGQWYQDTPGGKNYTIPNDIYGKPLVLVPGLDSREANIFKHGFAEAAGDRLFASLVQLDQSLGGSVGQGNNIYDATGKLIRKPGAIFKSPLHFIGFGQGATVNNEAIQRLGTFFPDAYNGSGTTPDLQMTTIDAPDPTQPLAKNLYDPEIKIWENVTFADNYYQTATFNPNKAFSGQNLADADLNVFLGEPSNSESRTGFTIDKKTSTHNRALGWYGGTANLSQQTFPSVVKEEGKYTEEVTYRRLGDLDLDASGKPSTPTWYTPDYKDSPFEHGDEKAPWEGIGTGWFYSVLGGGKDVRHPQLSSQRTPVSYDNTNVNSPERGERVRGDYTVPTLFNGNFDAITPQTGDSYIPGWSFNNSTTLKNNVVFFASDKDNQVLKLESGKGEKITHNPFIIPESGDLRFDLRLPAGSLGETNRLNVSLNPMNAKDGKGVDQTIFLTEAEATLGAYESDRFKIGYKPGEFETFHIDIPRELRGKPATLSFGLESLSGSKIKVFLDDVFFGSELLKLANPTEARPDSKSGQYNNNYLIEKPQYLMSYNNQKHTPNWVGWEVNKSWLSKEKFTGPDFTPDPELKETGWYQVKDEDYDKKKTILPDGFNLERGHLTARQDRTRSKKDFISTFLTTNIFPQHPQNNKGPWSALEEHLRSRADAKSDFTVFAGGAGTKADFSSIEVGDKDKTEIQVPSHIWKVVITRNLGDPIDLRRDAYAVIMPNENIAGTKWTTYRYSIQQLEDWLAQDSGSPKYDFLSGIKDDAQRNKLRTANENKNPPPALA